MHREKVPHETQQKARQARKEVLMRPVQLSPFRVRIHGPIALYMRLGVLRMTEAIGHAERIARERPDLARRIVVGEAVAVPTAGGGLLTFGGA